MVALLVSGLLPCGGTALAQVSDRNTYSHQPGFYSKYIIRDYLRNGKDRKTWFWMVDLVYRRQSGLNDRANIMAHPLRWSIRPYIGYQLTPNVHVMLCPIGYFNSFDRIGSEEDYADFSMEHEIRTTAELIHDTYIRKKGKEWLNVSFRHRMESRFRDVTELNGDMAWTFRYRFRTRFRTPLNGKHFHDNNVLYTVNYHEIHLENGPRHGPNKLSQMRNFFGLGYRFWDWMRIDVGYILQYNWRGDGVRVDVTHAPMFYLFVDYLSEVRALGRRHTPDPVAH